MTSTIEKAFSAMALEATFSEKLKKEFRLLSSEAQW